MGMEDMRAVGLSCSQALQRRMWQCQMDEMVLLSVLSCTSDSLGITQIDILWKREYLSVRNSTMTHLDSVYLQSGYPAHPRNSQYFPCLS